MELPNSVHLGGLVDQLHHLVVHVRQAEEKEADEQNTKMTTKLVCYSSIKYSKMLGRASTFWP